MPSSWKRVSGPEEFGLLPGQLVEVLEEVMEEAHAGGGSSNDGTIMCDCRVQEDGRAVKIPRTRLLDFGGVILGRGL